MPAPFWKLIAPIDNAGVVGWPPKFGSLSIVWRSSHPTPSTHPRAGSKGNRLFFRLRGFYDATKMRNRTACQRNDELHFNISIRPISYLLDFEFDGGWSPEQPFGLWGATIS